MLKAILFDFDGVILDTETIWYELYRSWLQDTYDYHLEKTDYMVCVGADSGSLFRFLEEKLGRNVDMEAFLSSAQEEFIRQSKELIPLPGVLDLIRKAKEKGIKLAIATSATRKKPEYHLRRLGLFEYFDVFSTAEESRYIKPEPDIFLYAAHALGVSPDECLVIEDSPNGVLAASRAHMRCVLVPNEITRFGSFTSCYLQIKTLEMIDLEKIEEDFCKK